MSTHSSILAWRIPWTEELGRLQPTRLLHPWDFPGKSTGVGCHILLVKWLKEAELGFEPRSVGFMNLYYELLCSTAYFIEKL